MTWKKSIEVDDEKKNYEKSIIGTEKNVAEKWRDLRLYFFK